MKKTLSELTKKYYVKSKITRDLLTLKSAKKEHSENGYNIDGKPVDFWERYEITDFPIRKTV